MLGEFILSVIGGGIGSAMWGIYDKLTTRERAEQHLRGLQTVVIHSIPYIGVITSAGYLSWVYVKKEPITRHEVVLIALITCGLSLTVTSMLITSLIGKVTLQSLKEKATKIGSTR